MRHFKEMTGDHDLTPIRTEPKDCALGAGARSDLFRSALPLLFFLLLALVGRAPDYFFHYRDWDEAAMMSQSWAMSRGEVLYRDIFQIHPPLNMLYFSPFLWLFEPDIAPHAVKVSNSILVALAATLIFRLCRSWLRESAVALLAGTSFVYMTGASFWWAQSSHGEFLTIVPLLASVALLFRQPSTPLADFLCGALWALAFFLKQVVIVDCLILLVVLVYRDRRNLAALRTHLKSLVAGALVVTAGIVVWLASNGAVGEAAEQLLVTPIRHYAYGPEEGWSQRALSALARELPWHGCACLVAGGAILASRSRVGPAVRALYVVSLTWTLMVLAALSSTARFYDHYLLQFVTPLSVASSMIIAPLSARARNTAATILVAALLVAIADDSIRELKHLHRMDWRPEEVRRSTAVAAAVRKHSAVEDRIFLYRLWNLDVHFLAERLAASGVYMYYDMAVEHMGDPVAADRLRASLLKHPPALIVTTDWMARPFPSLDDVILPLIDHCYRLQETVARVNIYTRSCD